ncbi:hypothetical protein Tco_0805471 [Tanacetum coccineum]
MAALKYRDEHNRIGFLEKPKGSTDYHQGVGDQFGTPLAIALIVCVRERSTIGLDISLLGWYNNINNSRIFDVS